MKVNKKKIAISLAIIWAIVVISAIVCFSKGNIDMLICLIAVEMIVTSLILYVSEFFDVNVKDSIITPKKTVFVKDVICSIIFIACLTNYLFDVFSSDRAYLIEELKYRVESISDMDQIDLSEFNSVDISKFVDNIELAPRSSLSCLSLGIGIVEVANYIAAVLAEFIECNGDEEAMKNLDLSSIESPTIHAPYEGEDRYISKYCELIVKIPTTVVGFVSKESLESDLKDVVEEMQLHTEELSKKMLFDVLTLSLIRTCCGGFFRLIVRTIACVSRKKKLFC